MIEKRLQKKTGSTSMETRAGKSAAQDKSSGQEILQEVLSKPARVGNAKLASGGQINGVVIGKLCELTKNGQALVEYKGMPAVEQLSAISTEHLKNDCVGCEVALSFIEGNPSKPIILGLIQKIDISKPLKTDQNVDVRVDGETLTLTADREIVLKCGKSSITLTKAGKIIVKGAYLSNHSTGVNRIKGGSVQIN